MSDTQHIVSVSSGLGSAFAWKLVCDQYGPENVTAMFATVQDSSGCGVCFLASPDAA